MLCAKSDGKDNYDGKYTMADTDGFRIRLDDHSNGCHFLRDSLLDGKLGECGRYSISTVHPYDAHHYSHHDRIRDVY